jgi:hypothetical protein
MNRQDKNITLRDLDIRLRALDATYEYQIPQLLPAQILNIIISESDDFNDFKKKFKEYVKYMNRSNNNQKLINYFKNKLGLNLSLEEGSNIQMKANKKRKGVINSINNSNNLNSEKITVRFKNNSTGNVKRRNIEKNNNS